MKIIKWINRLITVLITLLLIFLAYTVIISKIAGEEHNIFGYQLKSVLSGSMEPTFMTGSIIAIKPGGDMTRFRPGDVITFKLNKEMLVTHRIVEVIGSGKNVLYKTKGDHNLIPDQKPVHSQNVVGQYTGFTIPYAGYFFSYTSTNIGSALLLIIPGLLLIGNTTISLWRELSLLEKKSKKTINIGETPKQYL